MKGLDLSGFFTTKPEAIDFSARLSDVSAELYEVDSELEQNLQQKLGIKKKDKFMSLLRENQIPLDSNNAINKFIEQINKTISEMPEATITLAIEPNEEILKSITDWFLLNLEHQVLLEIKVDSDLVAGASIDYEGKRFNSSIKTVFEEVYPKHQVPNPNIQKTEKRQDNKASTKQPEKQAEPIQERKMEEKQATNGKNHQFRVI